MHAPLLILFLFENIGTLDGYDEKYDIVFQKDEFKETSSDEHETTFMDHQPNVDTNEGILSSEQKNS